MSPSVISADLHRLLYREGAVTLQSLGVWSLTIGERAMGDFGPVDVSAGLWHLPLRDLDDAAARDLEFFNDWLDHPLHDAYWDALDCQSRIPEITAPALLATGWYDIACGLLLDDYAALRRKAGSDVARQPRLIVGPWVHGLPEGDVNHGRHAHLAKQVHELFDWYDYWLKGEGELPEKPVKIFVMGTNEWREEEEWPLARAVYTPFYLHSGGDANTATGDGTLDDTQPGATEPSDTFTYDPSDPVPTNGGCFMAPGMGARGQRETEQRRDVLVYTSAPLSGALEVTGPIRMVLHAATSANDTDFTAKLCDVHPDGTSINLAEGIVRGRFREDGEDTPLTPGQIYEFDIDLWAISNVFLEGHRIRVQVSSSNFPQFDRNLNVHGTFARQTEFVAADQTIYHDAARPSHILLPIIPATE